MNLYEQKNYVAKPIDKNGVAHYNDEENSIWQTLIKRQQQIIPGRACDEFMHGLSLLRLSHDKVPQCSQVSEVLQKITGWVLEPVPALISFDHFFYLLANRRFPAATFIRRREDLDYIKEPDIFHEIFGHCPLLTNPAYAEFTHIYGKLGVNASPKERTLLARLFWFTVEFGLIETPLGLRAYGGGILSSSSETVYCLESEQPKRKPFDVREALVTSYHIDEIQPVYFVIKDFDQLFDLIKLDLIALIHEIQQEDEEKPAHPC